MLDIRRNYKRAGQVLAGGVMERTRFTSKLMAGAVGMLLLLSTLALAAPAQASGSSQAASTDPTRVAADASMLERGLDEVDAAAAREDWDTARRDWREFGELWLDVEDGFRDLSRDGYTNIEAAMVRVGDALRGTPQQDTFRSEVASLRVQLRPFSSEAVVPSAAAPAANRGAEGLRDLMDTLDAAI